MTGDDRDLWDAPSKFEQAGYAVVARVMEAEILDLQELAGAGKSRATRICVKGEYPVFIFALRHGLEKLAGEDDE